MKKETKTTYTSDCGKFIIDKDGDLCTPFYGALASLTTKDNIKPLYEFLKQYFEGEKEVKEYDFVCPHSGHGFNRGGVYWCILNYGLDLEPTKNIGLPMGDEDIAYFPTEQDAIQWSKNKFYLK